MRFQHRGTVFGGPLERDDRRSGVEFTGLAFAHATHQQVVAGEQRRDERLEHPGECLHAHAGLVEERPREAYPVGGALELTHERGRLEKDGAEGQHPESFRQHRVEPLVEVHRGRSDELQVEGLGP